MRRPFPLALAALAAVALFLAGLGLASSGGTSPAKLTARLGAKAEKPSPRSAAFAHGTFTGGLSGSTLTWHLAFVKLTGKASAAHIHLGKPGVAGPVAVPLCGPCASGASGTAKLTAKVRSALLSGGAYVNVHTAKNPAGEIRGQITGGSGGAPTVTTQAQPTGTTSSGGDDGGYGGYG